MGAIWGIKFSGRENQFALVLYQNIVFFKNLSMATEDGGDLRGL